tara:strand:+ start:1966 stop:2157 length:192 start_codon:yes stop_codon:yes gene_type:complete
LVDKAAINSYITSGGVAAFGGMTANEVTMCAGIFFAGATYFTNLFFKIREDRRSERAEKEKAA